MGITCYNKLNRVGDIWSRGRHFSPSLPGERYLNLGSKSDLRAEIPGSIVWYDALAPRPEVLFSFSAFYANNVLRVPFSLKKNPQNNSRFLRRGCCEKAKSKGEERKHQHGTQGKRGKDQRYFWERRGKKMRNFGHLKCVSWNETWAWQFSLLPCSGL